MTRPEFGNPQHIAERKKKKGRRNVKLKGGLPMHVCDNIDNLIVYKLCKTCAEKTDLEVIAISEMLRFCCQDCRERILKIAVKQVIIGGLIRLNGQHEQKVL